MNDNKIEPGDNVRINERRSGDYVEGIVIALREDVVDVLVMRCGPRSKFRDLFRQATETFKIIAGLASVELINKATEPPPRPPSAQRNLF